MVFIDILGFCGKNDVENLARTIISFTKFVFPIVFDVMQKNLM